MSAPTRSNKSCCGQTLLRELEPSAQRPGNHDQKHDHPHDDGHDHDDGHGHGHDHDHDHQHGASCGSGEQKKQLSLVAVSGRARLQILAMDCPTEAKLIEKALSAMPGVASLHFDFFERILTVEHALPKLDGVLAAIERVGMKAELLGAEQSSIATAPVSGWRRNGLFALSGAAAIAAEAVSWLGAEETTRPWVIGLALLSILTGGLPTLKKGWIALKSRMMNIHFLMTLAVGGALVIGQWPEAAMVLFLFSVAERLESMSLTRAGAAVRELMALAPQTAWVADGDGGFNEVAAGSVAIGARLRVRPGESVPLDGAIVSGKSTFNEASITGESLPCDKGVGQPVFAGSINGDGLIEMQVTAAADGSVLARIISSVRDAQATKAPTQRFIDRFSRYYTPLVVAFAVLLAIVLPLLGVMTVHDAVYQSLVLLVIACPCAMVIATPVTLVSALAAAARSGILIKGGEALETAARIRAVAFDKTGTLTTGRTSVARIEVFAEMDRDQVLALAAALDAHSTHPLARALVRAASERKLTLARAEQLREQPGIGVYGHIDGVALALGSRRLIDDATTEPAVTRCLDDFERRGQAALVLVRGKQVLGVIAVADTLRTSAAATIRSLAAQRVHSVMLSGDNQRVVSSVAQSCGVGEALGGLLPQDKLTHIRRLQSQYGAVAMVGDGVNDAPALAQANLGVAMGAASDSALETAGVALMDDRLEKLPIMLGHARRTMSVLKFNLGVALLIKLIFFVLALSGVATLWMAVFADVGASLLVVGNGLRLGRARLN